jgi:hypothetical protein
MKRQEVFIVRTTYGHGIEWGSGAQPLGAIFHAPRMEFNRGTRRQELAAGEPDEPDWEWGKWGDKTQGTELQERLKKGWRVVSVTGSSGGGGDTALTQGFWLVVVEEAEEP